MIARLTGRLVERDAGIGVIDVGGVGYEVNAPARCLDQWGLATEPVTVHVATHVREDAITLYGFATLLERRAFDALVSVSGVGPKLGLSALDALAPAALHRAIEGDDIVALGRIPGVGKKTAMRLALELKGKLPVDFSAPHVAGPAPRRAPEDALPLALAQLEYAKSEIDRALAALADQGVAADAPLQVRLGAALRVLAQPRS